MNVTRSINIVKIKSKLLNNHAFMRTGEKKRIFVLVFSLFERGYVKLDIFIETYFHAHYFSKDIQ